MISEEAVQSKVNPFQFALIDPNKAVDPNPIPYCQTTDLTL